MSWRDDDIDELFREASKEVQIPAFEDRFFEEFEQMKHKQERERKSAFPWFGGTVTFLIFSLGAVFLYWMSDRQESYQDFYVPLGGTHFDKAIETPLQQLSTPPANKLNASKTRIGNQNEKVQAPPPNSTKNRASNHSFTVRNNAENVGSPLSADLEIGKDISGHSENPNPEVKQSFEKMFLPNRAFDRKLLDIQLSDRRIGKQVIMKSGKQLKNYLLVAIGAEEALLKGNQQTPTAVGQFEIGRKFGKGKWQAEVGLRWRTAWYKDLRISKESNIYGLGLKHFQQEINYRSLNSIELPLRLNRTHRSHSIGLGVALGYNLGSRIDLQQYEDGQKQRDDRYYFNDHGIKKIVVRPEVSYRVQLGGGYELGASLSGNLFNPIDQQIFNQQTKNLPLQGQIQLKKSFRFK